MTGSANPQLGQGGFRQAVRAIVLDGRNRVLLFRSFGDRSRTRSFWITPGGGVADGESDSEALRRELREECGLRDFAIGPHVWFREVTFPLPSNGEPVHQRERFYVVRVDAHEVDISGWDDFEREFMDEHHWWTLEELRRSTEEFAPARLPEFLPLLMDIPLTATAFDIGR